MFTSPRSTTVSQLIIALLIILSPFNSARAQDQSQVKPTGSSTLVTASATRERVRFTTPNAVTQLRLEVYSEAGQKVFDTELRGGNVLDWHLLDGAGLRVSSGTYACLLTIRNLSGRLSQKMGLVTVGETAASVQQVESSRLNSRQAEAVGPVEAGSALVILGEGETPTSTALMHDGSDGQLARTRGALSFRLGDYYSGTDREQMRLTEEGNLGIGTEKPEARLDVNGVIRARQGIQFSDGSILNLSRKGGLRITLPSGVSTSVNLPATNAPSAVAATTQNYIPKFETSSGTLTDSSLFEAANGFVGWGTTTPAHPFTVRRNGGTAGVHSFGELFVDRDDRNRSASMILGTGGVLKWIFGMPYQGDGFQVFDLQATPAPGQSRFFVHPTNGNVGIGTIAPIYKLDVAGTLRAVREISNDMVVQTTGGTNAWARMWMITPSQRWTLGTSQNFNGNQLYLFDDTFSQTRMSIQPNSGPILFPLGEVGIGAGASLPIAKLHVSQAAAAPGIYSESPNRGVWGVSTGGSYGVYGESVAGIGMQGVSTNNIGTVGASTNNIGVYGTSTSAISYGGYFRNSAGGFGLGVEGTARVIGGRSWTSNGWANTLELDNVTAIGWRANAAGQRFGIGQSGGGLYFFRTASDPGTTGSPADYDLVINDAGNVGIGTTTPLAPLHITTPSGGTVLRLQRILDGDDDIVDFVMEGFSNFDDGGIFGIRTSEHPTAAAWLDEEGQWNNTSDRKLKTNIRPLQAVLSMVKQLPVVTYQFKSKLKDKNQIGVIAQDVNRLFPEFTSRWVDVNGETTFGVNYSKFGVVALKAIQEQQALIEEQAAKIERLEKRVAELGRVLCRATFKRRRAPRGGKTQR